MIETRIGIDGMACEMCEAHINEAIRRAFKVKSAKADRKRKLCTVVSEEPLDELRLRETIAQTGYELTGISSGPYEKKGLFGGLFG